MAEALTIARPYAEAAFKLALESGDLPAWSGALARLAQVAQADEARQIANSPSLTPAQVSGILADTAGDLSTDQKSFVRTVAENGRLGVLPEIAAHFARLRNEQEGAVDATVQSAFALSDAQTADIQAILEKKYGRKVSLQVELEPELIGGVSIRVGDEVMDASVRGKLSQLAGALKV
ncbi:MAG: F0F1 ATP synthase subunit delta [Burkholderiaceae bacterium]